MGTDVKVRVFAINVYGDSLASESGSGAILVTYPDAPVGLIEDAPYRGRTQIGLKWSPGASNGGTSIIDYTLFYDQGTGNFIVLTTTPLK